MPVIKMKDATNANKWVVAFTVMFGTFMAVMDITVVNVALPHMMGTFSEDLSTITWVATSYSIAQIIMVTMSRSPSARFSQAPRRPSPKC